MSGSRLGPYEIVAPLGAGGMGEVYKARDTRLDRTVAIKILPEALAADPQFRERFDREARTISQLDHPHICALHDIGEHDGTSFLVMQYLEGETLEARLKKGALPLDQALQYAIHIADALAAAHKAGIVHRDFKPGNIMLTKGGARLLDFGLAKTRASVVAGAGLSMLPTTPPITQQGTILGTFQYMAPEQLEGQDADARTDIFAFGAVVYEMLTGKKAFEGKSHASLIGAIMQSEPLPISTLQPLSPGSLDRVVRKCLAKDPDERWQSAKDLHDELTWVTAAGTTASGATSAGAVTRATRDRLTWTVAGALLMIAAGGLAALAMAALGVFVPFWEHAPEPQMLRYTIPAPEEVRIQSFAVSPDGRYVAISTVGGRGSQLWVRALDSLQAQALPGTETARYPFWSPDSRYIGFFAQGKIKKIAVTGGPAQPLGDAPNAQGGTWNGDGVIVFNPDNRAGLSRVSAAGGTPVPITEAGSGTHVFPEFLPDGRRFLYLAFGGNESGIYLTSLDSKENRRVQVDVTNPRYLPPKAGARSGHLLFVREQTLMAQPVDPRSLEANGEAVPVADQVSRGAGTGDVYSLYSISGNDELIYQTSAEGAGFQHAWFDRNGKELETVGDRVHSRRFALSPDGTRVVVERSDVQFISSDLYMSDLEHKTASRFTFDASVNSFPIWSPDGRFVVFNSTRGGGIPNLYQKAANTAGPDELLLRSEEAKFPFDWSRDGKYVIFVNRSPKTKLDLWALPVHPDNTPGKPGDTQPIPLVQTPFQDWMGQLSPDGRWLAYLSDKSGRAEVYVRSFAPEGAAVGKPVAGEWQVSTAGGAQPRWRADGKELFYVAPDRSLMSVDVKESGASFERTTPQVLFKLSADIGASGPYIYRYAPAPDGKRFLVSTDPETFTNVPPLNVVVNWTAALKK